MVMFDVNDKASLLTASLLTTSSSMVPLTSEATLGALCSDQRPHLKW